MRRLNQGGKIAAAARDQNSSTDSLVHLYERRATVAALT
jgi:hypothetical protein